LGGGVLGFPSLSLRDGPQQQHGPWWHVGVSGRWAFPQVWPVVGAVCGVDSGLVEELPNEFAALGAVVVEGVERVIM